jgi:hypothetical protein
VAALTNIKALNSQKPPQKGWFYFFVDKSVSMLQQKNVFLEHTPARPIPNLTSNISAGLCT